MSDLVLQVVAGADLGKRFKHASADARSLLRREMNSALLLLKREMQSEIGHLLKRRTGQLQGTITIIPAEETPAGLQGKVGSPMPYAALQRFGGTVTAKNAQKLAIPVGPMLTGAGVARGSARDVISSPSSYGFDSTFATENAILGFPGPMVLFARAKSVTIPPHDYTTKPMAETGTAFELGVRHALISLFQKAA